jgi:hypothetical protein
LIGKKHPQHFSQAKNPIILLFGMGKRDFLWGRLKMGLFAPGK